MFPRVPRYGLIDSDYVGRLRSPAADGPFFILNLVRYRPDAEFHRDRGHRAVWPDGHYAPVSALAAVGATLSFVAGVVASTRDWDRVSIVEYPSRRAPRELAERPDFQQWYSQNLSSASELMALGLLPPGRPPAEASSGRMLLEIWLGEPAALVASGNQCSFDVEGTLVGDGRQWSGARLTAIEAGTTLPLPDGKPTYQALLLEPALERWRPSGGASTRRGA